MARLGRSYVAPQIVRNPAPAAGGSYSDTVTATFAATLTCTEAYTHASSSTATVAVMLSRTEAHAHSIAEGTYGSGGYGGGVYGEGIGPVWTIPVTLTLVETYTPPAGTAAPPERPRKGSGQ